MATIPTTPRPEGDDENEAQTPITAADLADAQAMDAIMNSPYFQEGLSMGTVPSTDPYALDDSPDTGPLRK